MSQLHEAYSDAVGQASVSGACFFSVVMFLGFVSFETFVSLWDIFLSSANVIQGCLSGQCGGSVG